MSSQSMPADLSDPSIVSELALHELCLECFDECVHNDLPQYLIRISDMRLCSREELWETFRPHMDDIPLDIDNARVPMEALASGYLDLKKTYKARIKRHLKFAILSHRWGVGEPTFRDMSSRIHGERPPPEGLGYRKLLRFCKKAKDYECDFVWSDTCCINKESSAELDEAIRSMYRWYRDAYVCIVYLASSFSVDDFPLEPWFTRGWTLQELLAPECLRMFGRNWRPICPVTEESLPGGVPRPEEVKQPNDKENQFMLTAISKVTGIQVMTIEVSKREVAYASVAEKMRWASKRKTTRLEDAAYSLLGIFDVAIPIAYGEGQMAFRRLLEAIAQRYEDVTFLAWSGPCSQYSSALPPSPASYTTPLTLSDRKFGGDITFTIDKHGVQVKLLVIPVHFIPSGNRRYTLRPVDTWLTRRMSITGQIQDPLYWPEQDYAIGVVNYVWKKPVGSDGNSYGLLRAEQDYFCVVMHTPWDMDDFPELVSWKINIGVLPMVKCQIDYVNRIQTICLRHHTPEN